MKLLTLLLVGLSAVVLCRGTGVLDPNRIAPDEFCEPRCVNGHCIADYGQFRCSCLSNWYGENCTQHFCEVEDLCQNGGVCAPDPRNISDYLCSCPLGFTGRNCQYLTHGTACDSNPCGGNGTCFNLAGGGHECVCHPGYYGVDCSLPNNDLCTKSDVNNCYGNGVCTIVYRDGVLFPNCTCFPGYNPLSKCEFISYYNVCEAEAPCQNGGICDSFDGGSFYSCECPSNATGVNCTEPFNSCEPNPCQNGGICSPTFGDHYYECSCPSNYDGKNCEYLVNPCSDGRCSAEETCVVNSAPMYNGWYNASSVQTECLTCGSGMSHNHCSSAPCGSNGRCTSTPFSYVCECNVGWTGANCSARDHCAGGSPCSSDHTDECVNLPETNSFVCRCADGWGGNLCNQDIDECLATGSDPCNSGRCVNTLGGYSCEDCPPNRTGPYCEVLLTCDDMTCLNGGNCSDEGGVVSCKCAEGYTGVMCEAETCPQDCASVSGNGICNYECYTASCQYDGGDTCTLNPTPNDPWANCRNAQLCRKSFKDGVCNVQCNTAECLYDGGDCQPSCPIRERCELGVSDGQCSAECNTQECPYDLLDCKRTMNFLQDELVLILISSVDQPFSGEFRDTFLRQLGRLTNTVPSVIESRDITREEAKQLSQNYPVNLRIVYSRNDSVIIYLVRLRLDIQLCTSGCPTSTEDVINQIEANFESGNVNIGAFEVAGAYSQPPPPSDGPELSSTVIGVISALVVLVVCVALVVGVLLGKRKIHAKIWRPHSPAESDSGSTSQGADGRRRNSQAGGAVTGTESSLQHSDSDSFMEKGAKKAKMMADSSVEFEAVDGRYEVAHDSRKWNPAHYEALRNPRRVHELLVGYKRQHSDTLDVNAAGPGGFTPLMLVVMKRHSSHENIPGYISRPSSVSSEQAYASFYAPYQSHERTALVNGAAAGGRPISNGSILSRDSLFYPGAHGFVHPIDSSVTTLIKANVDLNATNDFGQTALQLAAACSRADYVEQLLEAGANPNITDNWGQSALQVAIGAGAEGSFMILINHPKTDLNQKSDGGITPLMAAVKVVNQYMLKMLIKKNADIAATDNDGRTALHWAAMVDNLDALKLLIRNGPETIKDAQDNKGQTALFLACREGSYGCVKHLIDCFANATLLDNLDQSPVHIAMQKQHLDIVALLQTQGPISYPPRVNLPYRPPAAHMDQEQLYQQYQATSRPLIKPFKSKSRQDHRNLVDHSAHMSYMNDLQRQQSSHEMSYFGGMQPPTSQQTFGDIAHLPISTDPSSIPMSALGQSSYSSGAAAAVASVSSVTSSAIDGGSPPVCMGNSVVNTHPVVTNYLMSNSEQSHPLQQSTTPPSSSQYASPPSAGYGNPSPGYEGELTDYMGGGTDIPSTSPSAGVAISQSLSPQSYNNRLPSSSSVVSPSQQLPSYSRYNAAAGYNQLEAHSVPVSSVYGTNSGSTRPLQHLTFVPPEVSMANQLPPSTSGGAPPTLAISEHHTSPPHMGSVSSGSPSSAYPSPGNELHSNYVTHGYYSSSRTSPPSLTPSPESRDEQMVNAHGTFHIEHHPHDYPSYHSHTIPPDSGMTMV